MCKLCCRVLLEAAALRCACLMLLPPYNAQGLTPPWTTCAGTTAPAVCACGRMASTGTR